ncbi:hypothetical protein PIB30_032847 [Stylosanthes scabra]|uniref:Uncharacterized protein n=1 Tax=Stylosanthes scabra TaxID=79078 RepID=A0ABU6QBS3_9FABA|nr:hypothetical protein [Stylosanthes scabra]
MPLPPPFPQPVSPLLRHYSWFVAVKMLQSLQEAVYGQSFESTHPPNTSITHIGAGVIRLQHLHPSPAPAASATFFPPIFSFSRSQIFHPLGLASESAAEDSVLPLPHGVAPLSSCTPAIVPSRLHLFSNLPNRVVAVPSTSLLLCQRCPFIFAVSPPLAFHR